MNGSNSYVRYVKWFHAYNEWLNEYCIDHSTNMVSHTEHMNEC
jgi:hypothetical protein